MVVNPPSTATKEIILSVKQLLTFRVIFHISVLISGQKIKVVTKGVWQPSSDFQILHELICVRAMKRS